MESAARRHRRRPTTRHLVLVSLLLALFALACAAVNVGEAESRLLLLDDNNGSSDDDVGCPDVKTLAVYNDKASSTKNANASNTSAQIVDPASCSKPLIVSAKQVKDKDKDTGESVYELDVRKQGIRRVASIPSAVRILYVAGKILCGYVLISLCCKSDFCVWIYVYNNTGGLKTTALSYSNSGGVV